jgi:hypothetical protein
MKSTVTAAALLAATASCAFATVTYDSQTRYVGAEAFTATGNPSDQIDSVDFGVFDESISRTFDDITAYATQHSELNTNGIFASGTAFGSFGSSPGTAGIGHSYIEVGFTLSEATDFTLNFTADGNFGSYTLNLGAYSASGAFNTFSVYNPSGTLDAGSYSILLDFGRDPFEDNGQFEIEGDYNFDLTFIPAPSGAMMFGFGALAATRRRR